MGTPAIAAVSRTAGAPPVLEPVTVDDPRPGEVLVRLVATGICHTDMVMRDGHLPVPMPVVLGHEGAGHVVAVGAGVSHVVPGDAVVLSFASCGACPSCSAAAPAYCHEFVPQNFLATRPDGSTGLTDSAGPVHSHVFGQSSFATHCLALARNTVKVDADLPLDLMGPLGCGFLTGAGAVFHALDVRPGDSLVVLGTGAVGMAAIMAAKIRGAGRIVAVDRAAARVELARSLGASEGVVADGRPLAGHGLAGIDHVLDTTGHVPLIEQAILTLAPRGQAGLLAAFAPGQSLSLDPAFIMSAGRVVRGIVEGSADPQVLIPQLIAHWRAGRFPIERLTRFYPFAAIAEAIAAGESGAVIKPIVRM
ncbi:NAD(P)-dependent alcohol dehydrogenase [Novosphingobium piscinae]|uniref:NAD(P)-dependent alcohol dehydrogenase n=1 Tax=Novosphingobium piscinae TaxID=1507448 RepID=A0A7X1FVL3_9SPHN|nr:NAD(P)-dependent alcohol dehydrogenase [Novosphingobium piscinae]MBC2667791.1 NAD(P)-dependent alcohol dehydrogenase [Novosphingobium piscinae]